MSRLTPRIASQIAISVYDIQKPSSLGGYRIDAKEAKGLSDYFTFDLSNGPIKGVSGGFFSHLLNRTTGFALVGQGKGVYKGDYVIALRGTDSLKDAITDLHCGVSGSATGATVHAGFNKTFYSMKPAFQDYFSAQLTQSSGGTLHCVGHSLGGALAGLTADWLKSTYSLPVNLYTFGSPRIGLQGFAQKTTVRLDNIFRCSHGADPVPKVPLWPFTHAPSNGSEYRLDNSQGFSPNAHRMASNGNPGYINTAKSNDWASLQIKSNHFLNTPVRLKYEDRHHVSYGGYWADKITSALITLLKDAGYYSSVLAQAGVGSSITFYDLVARTLSDVVKASASLAAQTTGLLGHMLVFAGQALVKITELTFEFIKWVFDKTINVLHRSVRAALDTIN
ncbi:lipase family protein [Psychromonas antarctica]|uniref:lipase family protein n=1 Tax=Psychromonas antarctica TaxID=67573 RepID=UPI001EE7CBE3|nr:lipase family protein [Psychromonas antarctica]MCG6202598.1 lipase family protein [Psychromonas antarctica]